jgi:hypothetical protein
MTLLNYWHYIFLGLSLILLILGVISALRQEKKKLIIPMLISTVLVSSLLAFFSVQVVDKYTKKVKVVKIKNKRLLSTEQIVYTGIIKNVGDFPIGKVTLEIKLVNKGHATGNVKGGNFYKPSGFLDFFTSGMGMDKSKPQSVTKTFVVARNLKAGAAKQFRVHFKYPGYFRSVSDFIEVEGK